MSMVFVIPLICQFFLSVVLIVHAFALMIELLIHGVVAAATPYHALVV